MGPQANFCSRKTHRKTRAGCSGCKKRKIKCDEQKPDCRNCMKHSISCDYTRKRLESISNVPSPPRKDYPTTLNAKPPDPNLMDLELLHNYSTFTSYTLSADPVLKNLWRINVPQIGLSHDFVMRGILALSALHIAYQKPKNRDIYISQAIMQHQTALSIAIPLLKDVTDSNCSALWIFSALTSFFTMASPRKPGDFLLVGESGIAEWLSVFAGIRSITLSSQNALQQGQLAPMFTSRGQMVQYDAPNFQKDDHLIELRNNVSHATSDPTYLSIYMTAIDELEKTYTVVYLHASPNDVPFEALLTWLYHFPPDYLMLLRDQTQEALSIFAYGTVLLHRLDFCWWMEGWSTHLISRIYYSLDAEHREWIRWPLADIGWCSDLE